MKYVKLTEVCKLLSGFAWSASKFNSNNCGVPIIRIQNVDSKNEKEFLYWDHEYNEKFVINSGDLLLTLSGSFRVVEWSGPRALLNQRIVKLIPNENKISRSWLLHSLKSKLLQIEHMGKHALVNNVSLEDLQKLALYLPPLPEQKRIADILDRADELRTKRRQAIEHLNELKQSIFLNMFGDPVTNPKGWNLVLFGDICESKLGKMLDKKQRTGRYLKKYLRNANVQWFKFNLDDVFEMDFNEKEQKMFRLQYGDLLICEGGEPGRAAIWRNEIEECYYQKALHCVRPKIEFVNVEYLAWCFWVLSKRGLLGDHITSATIAHLTGEKLKAMPIPLPSLILQNNFKRKIAEADRLSDIFNKYNFELDLLFSSLQDLAFKGELSKNDSLESILKDHAKNQNKQPESQL